MHLLTTCTMGFEGISGQDPLGNLGEMQVLVQLGWVGPGGSAFLARSQMVLTLLVCGPRLLSTTARSKRSPLGEAGHLGGSPIAKTVKTNDLPAKIPTAPRRKIPQAEHAAIHTRHPSQSSLGWTQTGGWRGAEPWSLLPRQLCTEARACFFFLCSKGLYLLT